VTGEVPTERVPAQVRTVGASLSFPASRDTPQLWVQITRTRVSVVNEQM
jgi:hypothetical protein